MQEFQIQPTSFQQVQAFVTLAARQPFDIRAGNEWQHINGKDLMGMFSLDYSRPVRIQAECSQEAFRAFQMEAFKLLTE